MNNKIRWLFKELPQLVTHNVINQKTADNITHYYESKIAKRNLRPVVIAIFGLLGATLLGSGIILLLAHNWDSLSRFTRTLVALIPLLLSQIVTGWIIHKDVKSMVWREGLGVFYTLMMGTAIAVIGQTYHIAGDLEHFLFMWAIGTIPVFYFLNSHLSVMLYLSIITSWATYAQNQGGHAVLFWGFFIVVLPYLYVRFKKDHLANRVVLLQWLLSICLCISIGVTLEKVVPGLWIIVYSSFFVLLYFLNMILEKDHIKTWKRPFRIVSIAGISIISYLLTYGFFWEDVGLGHIRQSYRYHVIPAIVDYIILGLFFTGALYFYIKNIKRLHLFSKILTSVLFVSILCFFIPRFGVFIFTLYFIILAFSFLLKRVNPEVNEASEKWGLVLLTFLIGSILYRIKDYSVTWLIINSCYLVVLFIKSKLFIQKANNFMDYVFKFIGMFGGLCFIYTFSFQAPYEILYDGHFHIYGLIILLLFVSCSLLVFLPYIKKNRTIGIILGILPVISLMAVFINEIGSVLFNLYFLTVGISIILYGAGQMKLGLSNMGVLIVMIILVTRFFDTELSFWLRGIVFIIIGALFIGTNIYIVRKKQIKEKT